MSVAVAPGASVFASWGKSFRSPAVIENACADPESPCPLPFALGDDPPLDPVKATTVEAGFRYATSNLALDGLGVPHERAERHLPHPVRRGGAGRQHHRRLLHQPRQDPPGRPRARRRLPVPGGPLAPTSTTPSPGRRSRARRRSSASARSRRRRTEDEVINPVPDRQRGRCRATGCRWCRITCSRAARRPGSGRYFYVGADARYTGKQ